MANTFQFALKQHIAEQFSAGAQHYDAKAKVQAEIGIDAVALWAKHPCHLLLDIGCGTGSVTSQLLPFASHTLGLDLSLGMLNRAKHRCQAGWVVGDADQLPLQSNSVNGVFSSMALQWSSDITQCFKEIYRVCQPNSKVLLGIMSEGSLHELHACWQAIDSAPHVNQFISSNALLEAALSAGFEGSVTERSYQSWHVSVREAMHSIKDIGAGVVREKRRVMGLNKSRLEKMQEHYVTCFAQNGKLPLTYQLSFLALWK